MKNNKKTIFLSGPIRGIDRKDALSWRLKAIKLLSGTFNVVHALRDREIKENFPDYRAAIIRDKNDILGSDLILVNDSFKNASMIGTSMEVMYAFLKDKPIIVFGNAHDKDYWLNYHIHTRVNSLDEACNLIKKMFHS